jgi:hypothetical protein
MAIDIDNHGYWNIPGRGILFYFGIFRLSTIRKDLPG